MGAANYFSADYAEARRKFISVAEAAGAQLSSYVNEAVKGPNGEELACDVARFGPLDASRVLLMNSGTHGAEGFCGSGAQIALMAQGWHRKLPKDTALVLSHAINPHGFAWIRRVTEDNVDLNRNFIDHSKPHPVNEAYKEVHPLLIPADWDGPARAAADAAIGKYIAERGEKAWQAAVSAGQHDHADGLFYGGRAPTWSNRTFRELVRRHLGHAKRVALLDMHTGLGPSGYGEPIHVGAATKEAYAEAVAWYGSQVTDLSSGGSSSAVVTGATPGAILDLQPVPPGPLVALEYGTIPMLEVFGRLRADHWLHAKGDLNSPLGKRIKQELRDAFYTDTDKWKEQIVERAIEFTDKAYKGLAA